MDGKARFIFPIVMTAILVFMVSAVITLFNIGVRPDFLWQWLRSFAIAWPAAAIIAFFAIPVARRTTQMIVAMIEKHP